MVRTSLQSFLAIASSPRLTYATALPCDRDGIYLNKNTLPPPRHTPPSTDWSPFSDRPSFEFAERAFEKCTTSRENVDHELRVWASWFLLQGHNATMYRDVDHLLATIDAIPLGDIPWYSFSMRYTGPINGDSPSWKTATYTVHARNTFAVQAYLLQNQDFVQGFNYIPYKAYTSNGDRVWTNLMSGEWAWKRAVRI